MAASRPAILALERQQITDLVVSIRDVDPHVLVVDIVADQTQLARVGVRAARSSRACAVVLDERRLLVRALRDVPGIDEAEVVARPEDAGVIEQHLQEQIALIARRSIASNGSQLRSAGTTSRITRISARGPTWMPPTPHRFGSMNFSESCQRALVRSQTASSLPYSGCSACATLGHTSLELCALVVGERQRCAHVGARIEIREARECTMIRVQT